MTDFEKRETELRRRLAYLENRLENIEEELDAEPNRDWEENAVEHEFDEVLEDLGNKGLVEMRAINAALNRIKDGSYGECVTCGKEISEDRLDAVPHTPFCRNCVPGRNKPG